jgi:hypothetical protein
VKKFKEHVSEAEKIWVVRKNGAQDQIQLEGSTGV